MVAVLLATSASALRAQAPTHAAEAAAIKRAARIPFMLGVMPFAPCRFEVLTVPQYITLPSCLAMRHFR